jgi:hypothetical protein
MQWLACITQPLPLATNEIPMTKTLSLVLAVVASALLRPGDLPAQRVDNCAIHDASGRFRAAVVDFEKRVKSVRGIDRREERVVDKFEESTKRVQFYARNPRQTARLKTEYQTMLGLQAQAEVAIFRVYTPHHDLIQAWQHVLWCQAILEQEFAIHFEYPRRGNRVRRRSAN